MAERLLSWAVVLATLALGLHLLLVLAPQLAAQSGGGLPFDLRVAGYTVTEARAYVAQLTPQGLGLYLGAVRVTDTLLPILLMVTLMLPLRGRGQLWFLPALVYGLADLAENLTVARFLQAGAGMEVSDVILASSLTQVKFAGLAVAAALALWTLWTRWRER